MGSWKMCNYVEFSQIWSQVLAYVISAREMASLKVLK